MSTDDFWSATIAAFQPLIESPALTEKLLQRPPFRFIHDIVTSIDQRFMAYNHLFTEEEKNAGNLDTKEKKIAYLDKLTAFISLLLGRPVDVSAKKIVAGQEPERTNMFMRDLALAVGYAQQYKQQLQEQSQPAAPPPPPPPQVDPAPPPPPPPPPPQVETSKPTNQLRINTNAPVCANKDAILKEATDFVQKIAHMGIGLNTANAADVKISDSIRAMERELKSREALSTEPSSLPVASLEIAIQRQLDSLNQIKALIDENGTLCTKMIEATMSTF